MRCGRPHHCAKLKLQAVCPCTVHPHLELAERTDETIDGVPDHGEDAGRLGAVRAAAERDLTMRIGRIAGLQALISI